MAKSEKTFAEKVLHVIDQQDNERGGGTVLRVMSWIVDGKEMKPCLDKRDWYMTEDGERRVGKAKSLTAQDFLTILRNRFVIAQHLRIARQDVELAVEMETVKPQEAEAVAGSGPNGEVF